VDPYLGQPWASAADGDAADVDAAVAAARRALTGPWGQLTGFGRAALMRRLGDLIVRDADRLAEIETRDTGKLLREMRGQLGSIPDWFYYFSGLADKLEGSTIPVDKPNFLVYTRREPAGVVAAIVPWNSPLLLLCWKLAALMAEAGFPPGVFNVVTGFGPAVVFAATGQTCMAGSRLLVSRAVHDELVARITERAASIKLGDPKADQTEMGPVATEPQYRKVLSMLDGAAAEGATVAAGGRPGAGGDPVRHRGRGRRAGQRQPLRAGRRGVDQGRAPRPPGRARAAHRHGVDQRVPGGGAGHAVRRVRAERAGPGERHRGGARVHPDQGDLGRALSGGTRDPFTLG
jgi:acyl-CoA reductase-like NAD-dependent aldehyde dehydrogenase